MKSPDDRIAMQKAMRAALPQAEARLAHFYAMQEYQLGWRDEQLGPDRRNPGKLLRPRLCLLACRVVGGEWRTALPLAASIQLLHNFSLVHDDIEDQSATRRGRPTVWALWGIGQAVNAGDGMFCVAHLALQRLAEFGIPARVVLEVIRRLDQTVLAICEGQFLDLKYEADLTVTEADYLAMIGRKTAALVAAATELGAIVGGADPPTAQTLFEVGRNLGLAFQIQDDLLGIWGDPALTGKPAAADLYRRKLSLPIIYALRNPEHREPLARLYTQKRMEEEEVRQILEILEHAGTQRYVKGLIAGYHQKALDRLDSVHASDAAALAELRSIAEELSNRQS